MKTLADNEEHASHRHLESHRAKGWSGKQRRTRPARHGSGKAEVAEPNSVCTQTWIVAGPLKSKKQAEIVACYLQTSFARFIVSLRKISQDAMKGVYRWLPQQDWNQDWTTRRSTKNTASQRAKSRSSNRMVRPMGENEAMSKTIQEITSAEARGTSAHLRLLD